MKERTTMLLGVGAVVCFVAGAVTYDTHMLRKLPLEERAAVIMYRENEEVISSMRNNASDYIGEAKINALYKNYGDAQGELTMARFAIRNGMGRCPPETTKKGSACIEGFLPLRKEADELSKRIESGIKVGKQVK